MSSLILPLQADTVACLFNQQFITGADLTYVCGALYECTFHKGTGDDLRYFYEINDDIADEIKSAIDLLMVSLHGTFVEAGGCLRLTINGLEYVGTITRDANAFVDVSPEYL